MTTRYTPNVATPFPGDDTRDLDGILKEVKGGCAADEKKRQHAQELTDWYDGDSEKYVSFRPSEDALSWLTRPKRVSFITRQAVRKLTSHLYKPGPRVRRYGPDDQVDDWYRRVAQDWQLNSVLKECDRWTHLHGVVALGCYATGDPARPVGYHLFPRTDFCYWADPAEPRRPTAVCTITRMGGDLTRYRLWTKAAYYTFLKGRDWGYQPGGWGSARYRPDQSGPHPYGVLPFALLTHEVPTVGLDVKGVGYLFAKINKALNIDMSNLALWVHHYGRPLGWVTGADPTWRPKFVEGGFITLPTKYSATEDAPVEAKVGYLQASLDIASCWNYIRGQANAALQEIDVPVTTTVQGDGGGAQRASGLAIAADEADLVTYARGRQPLWERHEADVFALAARVGACEASRLGGGLRAKLASAAADPELRLLWPEVAIDLPGRDRDDADGWELDRGILDPIELLMRRQGLNEDEATEAYRATVRRRALAAAIVRDEAARQGLAVEGDGPADAGGDDGRPEGDPSDRAGVPADPTCDDGRGPAGVPPAGAGITPHVTVTTAVDPQEGIPAAPLILPSTPGFGGWGTEV